MNIRRSWLGFLMLFYQLLYANSASCPGRCDPGYELKSCKCLPCGQGQFTFLRNGQPKCYPCSKCSAEENQIEVTTCTNTSNRLCHCKPGFFCRSPVRQTCRRPCEPCTDGFLSTSSLHQTCRPFTNCASLNQRVIEEGSPTQDRKCSPLTSVPEATSNPATSSDPDLKTTSHPSTTSEARTSVFNSVIASTEPAVSTVIDILPSTSHSKFTLSVAQKHGTTPRSLRIILQSQEPDYSSQALQQNTSAYTMEDIFGRRTKEEIEGTVQPSENPREPLTEGSWPPTWMVLLLMISFLIMMLLGLCVWCKGKTLKKTLDCSGLAFGKSHLQHWKKPQLGSSPVTSGSDAECSFGSEAMSNDQNQHNGTRLCPGINQQVTIGHNRKGESISNTVGSIFIYSPGMVILGSNSKDGKAETEENGEAIPLMSVPQQESSTNIQNDDVRWGMQEEFGKDLNFPVPATGK